MDEGIGEECGVAGIYLKKKATNQNDEILLSVPQSLINLSLGLEHRGQKSAGMCVCNPLTPKETRRRRTFVPYKDVGRVSEVYKIMHKPEYEKILQRCKGVSGIAHVRYSTSGSDRNDYYAARDEVQPFLRDHSRLSKRFALGFNGNVTNADEIRERLEKRKDCQFETEVDTEVIRAVLAMEIKKSADKLGDESRPDPFEFFKNTMQKLEGCYNIVSLFGNGDLIALRDPNGFRPLVYGENEDFYAVASENYALEKVGINNFTEVEPGEILVFNSHGLKKQKAITEIKNSFCHFEYVYFAKSKSTINGQLVRNVRHKLGKELTKTEKIKFSSKEDYLIVPVPKTAFPAAEAYSEELGIKLRLAIEKEDLGRGFINGPEEREKIMERSYTIHSDVKNKKVIVIEDSFVRGETIKIIINLLKNAGAKEIHIRSTEPPILHPCYYGIDFPTREELIAPKFLDSYDTNSLEEKLAGYFNVESVGFQTIEGLVRATGLSKDNLCLACLTGAYPVSCGQNRCGGM